MSIKYHLKLNKQMLEGAKIAIIPGDPGRVKKTALILDKNSKFLASNREYTSYLSTIKQTKILICSSGIGGPSLAIALEELAALGVKKFIRIGTTGAIQNYIEVPSLIITTGAVRLDGTSTHYAPLEYPAVADFYLVKQLIDAAEDLNLKYYTGITASSDTFYPGQERYDTFTNYVPRKFQGSLKEWQKFNVLNYEMESSTLYTVAATFGLQAACIASVIVNRTKEETPDDTILEKAEKNLADIIKQMFDNDQYK